MVIRGTVNYLEGFTNGINLPNSEEFFLRLDKIYGYLVRKKKLGRKCIYSNFI